VVDQLTRSNGIHHPGHFGRLFLFGGVIMLIDFRGIDLLLDEEDKHLLYEYRWFKQRDRDGNVYLSSFLTKDKVRTKNVKLHRLIIGCKIGEMVDHINGNTMDNRKSNLRLCTFSQNRVNAKKQKNNTSGYPGVTLDKRSNKWHAQICKDKRWHSCGYWNTPEQAYEAYLKKGKELYGEFIRTPIIDKSIGDKS